jgi:radical SAM protein with 4Fe4S-binding SPASM domain
MKIVTKVKRAVRALSRAESHATLEITTIFPCVNACKFCPQDKWRKAYTGKHRMTYDDFCRVLEKIPRDVRLDFSGFSEPFANRDAALMMRRAYQEGYQVGLFTTLVGFRKEDLEIIRNIPFYPCNLHLPDDTNFRVANEDRWLEAYRLFVRHIPIDNAVCHMGNVSARIRREVEKVYVYPVLTRSGNVDPDVAAPVVRHAGVISCATSGNLFRQNVVMPNGDVYLCCMDWSLEHKLGNLFEQSYEELYQGDEYDKIRCSMKDESIETICRYCERAKAGFNGRGRAA